MSPRGDCQVIVSSLFLIGASRLMRRAKSSEKISLEKIQKGVV
jgi:hypothetical protein